MDEDSLWGSEQKEGLNLGVQLYIRCILWWIIPYPKHKVTLEGFEAYGALWVITAITNPKSDSTHDKSELPTHTKDLQKDRKICSIPDTILFISVPIIAYVCQQKITKNRKKEEQI